MTPTEPTPVAIRYIARQAGGADIQLPLKLAPKQSVQFVFSELDGSPAVGIMDVIHRNPEIKGNGTARITWAETLEWGPTPPAVPPSADSWQKVTTITSESKSPQEVLLRFFFLARNVANTPAPIAQSAELNLSAGADQTIELLIKANSSYALYPNAAYVRSFVAIAVVAEPMARNKDTVIGTLRWSEEWHRFQSHEWARAIVFYNTSSDPQKIKATFRTSAAQGGIAA